MAAPLLACLVDDAVLSARGLALGARLGLDLASATTALDTTTHMIAQHTTAATASSTDTALVRRRGGPERWDSGGPLRCARGDRGCCVACGLRTCELRRRASPRPIAAAAGADTHVVGSRLNHPPPAGTTRPSLPWRTPAPESPAPGRVRGCQWLRGAGWTTRPRPVTLKCAPRPPCSLHHATRRVCSHGVC